MATRTMTTGGIKPLQSGGGKFVPLPTKPAPGGGEFGGIKNYETPPPKSNQPIGETPYSDPALDRLLNHPLPSQRISMAEYYAGLLAGKQARDAWNQEQQNDSRKKWEFMMEGARGSEPVKRGFFSYSMSPPEEFKPTVDPMDDVTWKPEPWRTTYPDGTPIPGARRPFSRIPVDKTPQQMQQELIDADKERRRRAMREALGFSEI